MKTSLALWCLGVLGFGALVAASGGVGDRATGEASSDPSGVQTREVAYEHDGVALRGFLATPKSTIGKRNSDARLPGVVIVHAWRGHSDYARRRAEMLAELGYAAFALDMYGDGVYAETTDEARRRAMTFYNDRDLMRTRFNAGLDAMLAQDEIDPARTGAIGYCFGGTVVLEAARTGSAIGVDLDCVVGFHAGLAFDDAPDDVGASVLVCNGYADRVVPPEQRQAFMDEMQGSGVDFVFIEYADAVHAFTDPGNADRYDERADRRSWVHMQQFLLEHLDVRSE